MAMGKGDHPSEPKKDIPRIATCGGFCSHDTTIHDYNKICEYDKNCRKRHL